jgi:probable rRNA maturation factor
MDKLMVATLEFYDHQTAHAVEIQQVQTWTERALPLVLALSGPEPSNLSDASTVEFSFVDDATIGQVHAEFLNDPTPTDVITFHHGEILISTETAARQCEEHGTEFIHELTLYAIHGLLHLHGYEDHTTSGAALMKELQQSILIAVLT